MPTTELMQAIRIADTNWRLVRSAEIVTTGRGMRVREMNPTIWRAKVDLVEYDTISARSVEALIEAQGTNTFYAWDAKYPFPAFDPSGSILGSAAVQINAVNNGNRFKLSLKGLPAAYVLSRGDYLSFDIGSRRFLHRISTATVTANGSGVTPEFDLTSPLPIGAAANLVVTLKQPTAEMMIVPGTFDARMRGFQASMSFEMIESHA